MRTGTVIRFCKKTIFRTVVVGMMTALPMIGTSFADDFVGIKIYPEHIGIFTNVGQQQFVAFGVLATGNLVNITKEVDWISSDKDRVTIDKNGLAKIVDGVTFGQVKITCAYPKTQVDLSGARKLLLDGARR